MRLVLACTLFAVIGFGLSARLCAQDDAKKEEARPEGRERPQPERMMKEWDKNGDGKLTLDEIPAERKDFFLRVRNRADQDGDEALSLDELQKAFAAFRERPADAGERPARPARSRTSETTFVTSSSPRH